MLRARRVALSIMLDHLRRQGEDAGLVAHDATGPSAAICQRAAVIPPGQGAGAVDDPRKLTPPGLGLASMTPAALRSGDDLLRGSSGSETRS